MKQLIEKFIPDESTVWKMAALVLLFLLAAMQIVNSFLPLFQAPAAPVVADDPKPLTTKLIPETENVDHLYSQITQNENQIAQITADLNAAQQEITRLQTELAQSKEIAQEDLNKAQEKITLLQLECEDLCTQLDNALAENVILRQEMADLKAVHSVDHVVVVKICRAGLWGDEAIYIDLHVDAAEYARHRVGEQMQPVQGMDFPTSGNWNAIVTNMYISTLDV